MIEKREEVLFEYTCGIYSSIIIIPLTYAASLLFVLGFTEEGLFLYLITAVVWSLLTYVILSKSIFKFRIYRGKVEIFYFLKFTNREKIIKFEDIKYIKYGAPHGGFPTHKIYHKGLKGKTEITFLNYKLYSDDCIKIANLLKEMNLKVTPFY